VLGDIGVGVMAWLNIVAILLLQKPALKALKDYQQQRKQGLDPHFNAAACGINGADEWNVPADVKVKEVLVEK
jgi:AGCS family alanine or glycine:cation symporter